MDGFTIRKKTFFLWLLISFIGGVLFAGWAGWSSASDRARAEEAVADYVLEFGEIPADSMVVPLPDGKSVVVVRPGREPITVTLPPGISMSRALSARTHANEGLRSIQER